MHFNPWELFFDALSLIIVWEFTMRSLSAWNRQRQLRRILAVMSEAQKTRRAHLQAVPDATGDSDTAPRMN